MPSFGKDDAGTSVDRPYQLESRPHLSESVFLGTSERNMTTSNGGAMDKRRKLVIAVGAAMLTAPLAAFAQTPGKVWRIGFLNALVPPKDGLPPALLRKALTELGYVEGQNVMFFGRWVGGVVTRLPDLAMELVKSGVDVVVVTGFPATLAMRRATTSIPIVILNAGDAVGAGHVVSLARPGANLTGLSDMTIELSSKRLAILKETVVKASKIAVLWNMDDMGMTLRYNELQRAARELGLTIQALGVREPDDFGGALSAMKRERPDAIFMVADSLTNLNRKRVIEFAEAQRIPAMYEFGNIVEDGGLMSYGPNQSESFRRAAYYVDRILKGAKPADLPLEQPTSFELVLNMKTAKKIGLTIPESIMVRADKVIE